jgi:hypothetical protein
MRRAAATTKRHAPFSAVTVIQHQWICPQVAATPPQQAARRKSNYAASALRQRQQPNP